MVEETGVPGENHRQTQITGTFSRAPGKIRTRQGERAMIQRQYLRPLVHSGIVETKRHEYVWLLDCEEEKQSLYVT